MIEEPPPLPAEEKVAGPEPDLYVMPASVSQKRFWLLEQMSPGNTAVNIPIALRLSGPLRSDLLERALQAIVDRHEILRTRFEMIDGEPRQVIAPKAVLHLHGIDASGAPAEMLARRIREEMDREVQRPLDFAYAPLLRATLVDLAPDDHMLMLTAHHIVSDGWSNGVLVRELAAFYDALRNDRAPELPPLAIQYADFVVWQEQWLQTPEFEKQLGYWKQALDGEFPVLDVPTDFPRVSGQPTDAILESLLLPAELTEALKHLCQDEGVTLFMVFFSAYFALLHRYTGQTQLMIGTTAANRNKPELEALIGLFANILVLTCEVSGDLTFRALLQRQRDLSLSAFANHEVPFEMILDQVQNGKNGRLLLQTHFLFQRAFMQPAECGELKIEPLHSVSPGSTFELTFGIVERKEGIRLQMEYRTSLYRQATIQRLLRHFQALLESVVASPETAIEDLSLFVGTEREEIEALFREPLPVSAEATPPFNATAVLDALDLQIEENLRKEHAPSFVPAPDLPRGSALLVLDAKRRMLPKGIVGDLYLALPANANVAPLETVSGPADVPAPRALLPTGFLGRFGEGGAVELWGRAGDFVRVQGFRCNLLAVAAQLHLHPEVVEVAVTVHPLPHASTRLIGYVVLKPGSKATGAGLREFLKGRIGDLLLPSAIEIVPVLPRNAEGELLAEQLAPPTVTKPEVGPVPMQALLHHQMIEIWERLLKTTGIAITDNFFEIGGNSFLALRMMLEVGKLCGTELPLSLLLTRATISDLARFILDRTNEGSLGEPVVAIQPHGTRAPIFFLHGDWVGGGFYTQRLARQLGDDQPFYALPPFHLQETEEPRISSMQEIAAWHRETLCARFPKGPYVLGGYCIGATVAIELARLLILEGKTVTHLFLVDPPLWGGVWLRGLWPWVEGVGDFRHWSLEKKIDVFDRRVVALSRWLKKPLSAKLATVARRLGLRKTENATSPASGGADKEDFGDAAILDGLDFSTYFMSYRLHRLAPLSVPATLFLPESTPHARRLEAIRASRLDRTKARVEIAPGNHTTCVTQHSDFLADRMRAALDDPLDPAAISRVPPRRAD
jgi:surfactin synthase thioesterase subunit